MPTFSHLTIEERLNLAYMAITNAKSDTDIAAALNNYGYTQLKLQAGLTLHDEVQDLYNKQKQAYGKQYGATDLFAKNREAADDAYTKTLKVARVALKDNLRADNALGLSGDRKANFAGWLQQVHMFYQNMLATPEFMAAMSNFGYTQAKLEAERALLEPVREANRLQEIEKGEAQEATKLRDAKLAELDSWISDFRVIVQVALADTPQQLEKLGIVVS